jgi:hypothetical protein
MTEIQVIKASKNDFELKYVMNNIEYHLMFTFLNWEELDN